VFFALEGAIARQQSDKLIQQVQRAKAGLQSVLANTGLRHGGPGGIGVIIPTGRENMVGHRFFQGVSTRQPFVPCERAIRAEIEQLSEAARLRQPKRKSRA
jgi:hypothetical protein